MAQDTVQCLDDVLFYDGPVIDEALHGEGTEVEVEFAEHMCSRSPAFQKIRFMNSGSEAVMAAIKAARAFTGRPKIAKVEGAYHGAYDYVEVSQTTGPDQWGPPDRPNPVALAAGTPRGWSTTSSSFRPTILTWRSIF